METREEHLLIRVLVPTVAGNCWDWENLITKYLDAPGALLSWRLVLDPQDATVFYSFPNGHLSDVKRFFTHSANVVNRDEEIHRWKLGDNRL